MSVPVPERVARRVMRLRTLGRNDILTRRATAFYFDSSVKRNRRIRQSELEAESFLQSIPGSGSVQVVVDVVGGCQFGGLLAASPLNQTVGGPFESSDVEALPPHHRLKSTLGAGRVCITKKRRKPARYDLPGQAVAIFNPAALLGLGNRR